MSVATEIENRAASWLVRREEADWSQAEQAVLDAWLEESMAHKAAYWRLEHHWRKTDKLRALGPGNVHAFDPERARPRYQWWTAIAASLLVIAGVGAAIYEFRPDKPQAIADARFATPVGGHRIVPLSDGSKIEMNTATLVRTAMTEENREVWLDEGEAYFEVAHREGTPFVVHAGSRTVTVLGTKFSVRRDGEKVTVSVVEGRVRVDDAKAQTVPAAIMKAGDIAIARGPSTLLAARSEERVESALAWRNGMLTFDQSTLADAAAEFNRYSRKRIEIADPEAAGIRIGGTFRASGVDDFAALLRDAYGLKVETEAAVIRISS
jgi:transmembrane sensor